MVQLRWFTELLNKTCSKDSELSKYLETERLCTIQRTRLPNGVLASLRTEYWIKR
jgi:hypothetical protein